MKSPVPFWRFWNPWSGFMGGIIAVAILFSVVRLLAFISQTASICVLFAGLLYAGIAIIIAYR